MNLRLHIVNEVILLIFSNEVNQMRSTLVARQEDFIGTEATACEKHYNL